MKALKDALASRGMSQKALAQLVKRSEATVSCWFNEVSPRPIATDAAWVIASHLGVPLHELRPDVYPVGTPLPAPRQEAG